MRGRPALSRGKAGANPTIQVLDRLFPDHALTKCLRMIFSEDRRPLFRIIRQATAA